MKLGAMRDWLGPILGAALLLGGAAGLAYKVISGYRHPSPDAFFSVQDQNRLPAASAAEHSTPAATVPVDVPASQQAAALTASPPAAPANSVASASGAAAAADVPAEAQDSPECAAIKSEQHEIGGALNKQYSPEEGRYLQRRLRELAEQSVKLKCSE